MGYMMVGAKCGQKHVTSGTIACRGGRGGGLVWGNAAMLCDAMRCNGSGRWQVASGMVGWPGKTTNKGWPWSYAPMMRSKSTIASRLRSRAEKELQSTRRICCWRPAEFKLGSINGRARLDGEGLDTAWPMGIANWSIMAIVGRAQESPLGR